ncbi:hypothetical protein ACFXKY_17120 [Streptomyces canus]|uniref:hypothetical protein n=1 Tax=Streptomyces canus TaxID=58343 RepID=UPI00367F6C14
MLVAAFSAVMAFGTLSGLSAAKGDAQAGDAGSVAMTAAAPADENAQLFPADSIWS